jgi:hypothetical protein
MKTIKIDEAHLLAKEIARKIVSQELSEHMGAMKIWKEIIDYMGPKCPDSLWEFKSNASAIEDIIWNAENGGAKHDDLIRECKQEIMHAAKKLL